MDTTPSEIPRRVHQNVAPCPRPWDPLLNHQAWDPLANGHLGWGATTRKRTTGAEGEETGRVLTDQDAIPVAGGGNPNPRRERESAQAGRTRGGGEGGEGERRGGNKAGNASAVGDGGRPKKIQLFFSRPRPLLPGFAFIFGISCAVGRFCPRYIRRFQNWPGSTPVTRGTRRGSGQNSVGNLQGFHLGWE